MCANNHPVRFQQEAYFISIFVIFARRHVYERESWKGVRPGQDIGCNRRSFLPTFYASIDLSAGPLI